METQNSKFGDGIWPDSKVFYGKLDEDSTDDDRSGDETKDQVMVEHTRDAKDAIGREIKKKEDCIQKSLWQQGYQRGAGHGKLRWPQH